MSAGSLLSTKIVKAETKLQHVTWDEVHEAFAPFAGTCLYAIRAEAFFHFALQGGHSARYRLKNIFYPATVAWRGRRGLSCGRSLAGGAYVLICDYAAEPGFGTLLPLLQSCDGGVTLVVNATVLAARSEELARLKNVETICADSALLREGARWRSWWQRSYRDWQRLQQSVPARLKPPVEASRRVLQTLLVRAYLYEDLYERCFTHAPPRAVITHNDFTALSYLAGEVARRRGIPDFTLQHGFPSQEYFPASASHYLVWGAKFQQIMNGHALNGTQFAVTGAPRLDGVRSTEERRTAARKKLSQLRLTVPGKLNVLFLSQSHTPLFSNDEHQQVLSLVGSLAREPWVQMLVRPHPQESANTLRSNEAFNRAVILPREISLAEAVLAADVVISVNSTAMLEAALLSVPVLQLALPSLADRLGILRFPRCASDLASAHAELWRLRDPKEQAACVIAQQVLVQACVHDPGRGADNVWRYIREHSSSRHMTATAASGPLG